MTAAGNLLALDIAFGAAYACINRRDGSNFSLQTESQRPHSQAIMPMLENLLEMSALSWSDLEMLACGIGPGSFTGLRIAAATVSGINSQLKLPVLEISSLAISAAQVEHDAPLYIIEDARSGMAYVGHYQRHIMLQKDACVAWDEIAARPAGIYSACQADNQHLAQWQYIAPQYERPQAMVKLLASMCENISNTDALPRNPRPAYINPSQAERHARSQ
ncbi:MAG: tRNA (adenosine(37)-N6)-threonylcarbamoyltransferase complex dimerization subunit type 1 TsaB [Mariprofundaceae bacterium]|nr:tRNA (adenosine(37)-N6)-threonylcarbamoyltransferase complex dimerization subunit type 1 TsaB [Mariprofundaceae bacterium]